MNRLELRERFASRIEKFHLDDFDLDVYVRKLSGAERAVFAEKSALANKSKDEPNALSVITQEVLCYVVSRGLVDENGKRVFEDKDACYIAEEFPGDALDAICERILVISKLKKPSQDSGDTSILEIEVKNSETVQSDSSSSGSPLVSDGGM